MPRSRRGVVCWGWRGAASPSAGLGRGLGLARSYFGVVLELLWGGFVMWWRDGFGKVLVSVLLAAYSVCLLVKVCIMVKFLSPLPWICLRPSLLSGQRVFPWIHEPEKPNSIPINWAGDGSCVSFLKLCSLLLQASLVPHRGACRVTRSGAAHQLGLQGFALETHPSCSFLPVSQPCWATSACSLLVRLPSAAGSTDLGI